MLVTLEKNIYEYINTIIKTDKSITDLCPEDITKHIYNMLKDKIDILVEDRVISNFNSPYRGELGRDPHLRFILTLS